MGGSVRSCSGVTRSAARSGRTWTCSSMGAGPGHSKAISKPARISTAPSGFWPAEFGEDLAVFVIAHQHGEAGNRGEPKARGNAVVGIGHDLIIALAGDFFPFAGRLFDFQAGDRRLQ